MKRIIFAAAVFAGIAVGTALTPTFAAAPGGDSVAGARTFGQCKVCHTTDAKGADGVGPNLYRVFGSKAAKRRSKFAFSPALKKSGLVWDEATLDQWLTDPAKKVPGTKMVFIGLPRKPARDNLIAYLKTLK